ncbi:type IV secretory system conjugative DNA transfer family protein [bacterium]|nr:type IV secretory system conjugative DNA transfer family protein [bacterium]
MPNQVYIIIGSAIGGLILVIFLIVIFKRQGKKAVLKQALNLSLFLVKIPPKTPEEIRESGKQEKEWIALMEDFYSSLTALSKKEIFGVTPWISLEIAKVGEEIRFYVAAPKRFDEFIEKQIYSIHPDAEIQKTEDFNIFAPKENVCGGYLKLEKPFFLPIKTYTSIETDPLSSITNTLTKLKPEEEAVIQIVFRKSSKTWQGRSKKVIDEMAQGKNFYQALSATGILGSLLGPKTREEKLKEEERTPVQPKVEEEVIKALEQKMQKDSFETNIRIIVSVRTKERSEEIFSQISGAFEQFSSPKLNGFRVIEVKGRRLRKLLYNYSFRIFNSKEKMILNTEELTSIFHFPTPFLKTPKVKILKAKSAAPPTELPREGLLLGYNQYREEKTEVRIKRDDRRRHLYIIGQTGTGKSSFLSNLIEQDIKNGEGIGVLDPHGDLIEDILGKIPEERIEDVILFDPSNLKRSIGLNMLEYDPSYPEQKTFIVNELINIFDKLYDLRQTGGPMFEQYTRNALLLLMDDPSERFTLMEVPKVMADKEFRHRLLAKCKNIVVKEFWEKEAEKAGGEASLQNMVPYITSKFNTFIANDYMRPIIGQTKSTFNFREIMDKGKVFLVNLTKGRLGDINSSLLGLIITGKLAMAAFSRIDIPQEERKDFYLYMDEFQNFATESISTILSEARKYRLCLIISHQFIGQLPEPIRKAVFGNVGTIMSFRVGAEDAEFLQKQFEPVFSSQDLINLDNFNAYIKLMTEGKVSKPFNIKTYPPSPSNKEKAKKIKEYCWLKYGRDRDIVEKEIEERRRR